MTDLASGATTAAADKRRQLLHRMMAERGLQRPGGAAAAAAAAPIPRRPAGLMQLPQSFAQQRLWFLDRLAPGNPFYTVSLSVAIAAVVDRRALQRSLDEVVRRHEALRTTFAERDGQALQCIAAPQPAALDFVDLRRRDAAARQAELERLTEAENARSFDLERGPLMVARLVTLAPDEHRLLLTLHHIVCDGWSLRVLSQELVALYGACASGRLPTLPELPVQYGDFALWQRLHLQGAELERQLAHWRRVLDGAPELRLCADRARPAIPSFRGGMVALRVDSGCARAVGQLAADAGTTPFVVLLAAFMVLLGRLSAQDDIVVGTPIANRTRPELEPMIGFFVNTLVLRADLGGEPSFRTVVQRLRGVALDAFAHQDLPFERLVEAIAPERVLGRNPLFQVIFQLFAAHDGALGDGAPAARQRGTAKFDLRLDLWPTTDHAFAGELEYSVDVFDEASARRIARQFGTLLAALVRQPDADIADADAMDDDERRQVVEVFNATAAPFPDDAGVHALFGAVARRHADRRALQFADGTLSYAQLYAAAETMAARLAARGVRQGDAVAMLLERSATMVVAWLAVLKLGAVYVPLDTEQPPARLAAMLQDAGCRLAVCTAALEARLQGLAVAVERAELPAPAPAAAAAAASVAAAARPAVGVRGGDVAHIIFTSGSTGRPKGVRIPHRGIARLTLGTDWVDFRPGDRVGQTSNPAFDASTYEVWSALLNGCTLVEIDRDTVLDAPALERRLLRERIDHLFLTTALSTRLVAERPGMFAPLKSLMTGGAKADVASFRAVLSAGAPRRLFNAYGPTETTVLGSVWTARALPADALSVPIGRPVTNTRCLVLDAQRRPVPWGAAGQLYIGGPGVALGYVGRPELSAERFVDDPWQPGGRLYATGDKVRWRHDGQLEFLGRFDDQIKIRGFRVEPDEVAAVLSSHPAVRSAVVLAREQADGENGLDAYVVLSEDLGAAFDAVAQGEAGERLVEHWRTLYDTVLYDAPAASPTFNTSGWNDSASGAPIAETAMAEQVEQTVQRTLASGARRVLEIGCGTGLLLFRLAPQCERYAGTDLSAAAIEHVRRTAAALPNLAHLELAVASATDLDALAAGHFDLVLLNSVVQYFPSFDYLLQVVRAAVARLAPGGHLYLGDLRHAGLLHAFHADVLLQRAGDAVPTTALREELARRLDEEQELALVPAALQALCRQVEGLQLERIELKRGHHRNELSRFRYDALLRWQAPSQAGLQAVTRHWQRDLGASLAALREALAADPAQAWRVLGLPNDRVLAAQHAARAIEAGSACDAGALRAELEQLPPGIDPEALWRLGDEIGRAVQLVWNTLDDAAFDALVLPAGQADARVAAWPDPRAALPLAACVTHPLRGHFVRKLVPELRAYLAAQLPAYMWPEHVLRLKQLPLTPNGKVDKAALPAPERLRPELQEAHVPARSDSERRLAALWSRLLGVDPPGVHDHFFNDLGGHSLLATQVMSRVRSEFGVELPLRLIFEGPTIAELAQAIDAARVDAPRWALGGPSAPAAAEVLQAQDVDRLDEAELDAALARLARGDAP